MSCSEAPADIQWDVDQPVNLQLVQCREQEGEVLAVQRLSVLDILSMCEASEEDMQTFKEALTPQMRETYDALDEARRWVLASLYQRGFDVLIDLHERTLGQRMVGFHDFSSILTILLNVPAFREAWKNYNEEKKKSAV